jgi:ABC-type glycerol-3-phosphate transport system substrate-binding protein
MRRRHMLWALLLFLIGCTPKAPADTVTTPEPTAAVTTITFLTLGLDQQPYQAWAAAFNAQHPTLHVEVLDPTDFGPAGPRTEITALLAALTHAADVVLFADVDAATLARSGLVRDLQPWLGQDTGFEPDDFYPTLLERYRDETGLWGLPLAVAPLVLKVDQAAWNAAGLAVPEPAWTWNEFVAAAQALTDPVTGRWGFIDGGGYGGLTDFVALNGARLVDRETPAFLDAQAVAALTWYADLAQQHWVMPPDAEVCGTSSTCWGAAGMWIDALGGRPPDEGTRVLALPQSSARGRFPANVSALYLSARASHPDAAWQWMSYLTRQLPPTGRLPVRRSVFDSPAYRERRDEATLAIYAHVLDYLTPAPWRYPWATGALEWLTTEGLASLLQGTTTAQAVLQEAQSRALAAQAANAGAAPAPLPEPLDPTPAADQRATVVMWAFPSAALKELARVFEEENPDIRIRFRQPPAGPSRWEKITESADVLTMIPGICGVWDSLFLDLGPLIEADSSFDASDFYPSALAAFECQGQLSGLPHEVDVNVLAYNKRLFDAAGLPYPSPEWTWDDVLVAAQRLTRGEAPQQWGLALPSTMWYELPLILTAQKTMAVSEEAGATSLLSNPDAAWAIEWVRDLALVHEVMPPLVRGDLGAQSDMFHKGQVAMMLSGYADAIPHQFTKRELVELGVIALPVTGDPATGYHMTGWAISARTAHPQAAWRWIEFLNRQPGSNRLLPARRSLHTGFTFGLEQGPARNEVLAAYRHSLEHYKDAWGMVQIDNPLAEHVLYQVFVEAVLQAWTTSRPAEDALRDAQAKFAAYGACQETSGEQDAVARSESCALEAGIPEWPVLWGFVE